MDLFPIILSLRVATLSTILAGLFGVGLAWLLTRRRFPGRTLLESVVVLPLVLPPPWWASTCCCSWADPGPWAQA